MELRTRREKREKGKIHDIVLLSTSCIGPIECRSSLVSDSLTHGDLRVRKKVRNTLNVPWFDKPWHPARYVTCIIEIIIEWLIPVDNLQGTLVFLEGAPQSVVSQLAEFRDGVRVILTRAAVRRPDDIGKRLHHVDIRGFLQRNSDQLRHVRRMTRCRLEPIARYPPLPTLCYVFSLEH